MEKTDSHALFAVISTITAMTNLNQNEQTTRNRLTLFLLNHVKELTTIQLILYSFNTLLIMIIFGSGIRTMITDVVGNFPIAELLYLPIGFALMVILVLATHYITDLSTELAFHWNQFATPYKILLPITNVILLIFCYSVQSEGGEILINLNHEEELLAIRNDTASRTLTELDRRIQLAEYELQQSDSLIQAYSSLRESRKSHWLNPDESKILMMAQESKQQLSAQLTIFIQSRIEESNAIHQRNEERITQLRAKIDDQVRRSRGKAGLAECLLVFTAFFARAYKNRFKVHQPESEETTTILEFPKNLSIDQREEMLQAFIPLYFHHEEHSLVVELNHQRYFISIPKVIKSISTCRGRLANAKSDDSKNTQLRNMAYYERLLVMTGLQVEDLKRVYGYEAFNLDYWENATGNVAQQVGETLQNRFSNDVQRSETVGRDLFE